MKKTAIIIFVLFFILNIYSRDRENIIDVNSDNIYELKLGQTFDLRYEHTKQYDLYYRTHIGYAGIIGQNGSSRLFISFFIVIADGHSISGYNIFLSKRDDKIYFFYIKELYSKVEDKESVIVKFKILECNEEKIVIKFIK